MANDRLLLGWQNEAGDAGGVSALADGYPAINVLDEDDLSLICRSSGTTLEIDLRLGTGHIGASTGKPTQGAPTLGVNDVVVDPTGRFAFAIENGALHVFSFDSDNQVLGARLADRAGSSLTSDQQVAVVQESSTRLLVAIAGSRSSGPGFELYPFDLVTGTWGARSSDPGASQAQNGNCICWLLTDQATTWALAIGHASTPFVSLHGVNRTTAVIASVASNPGSLPPGAVNAIAAFAFAGAWKILAGCATTPFLRCWATTTTPAWGGVYANPSAAGGAVIQRAIAVSRASYSGNAYVALGRASSPFVSVLPFSSSSFGTVLADPASLPSAQVNDVAFGPGDLHLAFVQNSNQSPSVYEFTPTGGGSVGTKLTPFAPPAGGTSGLAVDWTPDGLALVFGHNAEPWFGTRPFSATEADGVADFLLIHATNASLAASLRVRVAANAAFSPTLQDITRDFFPTGVTERMLDHYPRAAWVVLPSQETAAYVRITITDVGNPDGFVECGFIGVYRAYQPAINFSYGWRPVVEPLTGIGELESGHIVTDPRSSRRGLRFRLAFLTETELMEAMHPLQMQGPQVPVAALPKPNESTGVLNFMLGVWGPPRIEDDLDQPSHGRFATSLSVMEQI